MSQTTTTKRHREANDVVLQPEIPKRLKNTFNNNNNVINNNNNNNIIIINQQQDTPTPTQYLLDFFTTIPFEPDPFLNLTHQPEPDPDDDEKEKVIKHLFEASDDELGLPSRVVDDVTTGDDDVTGFGDIGLWELEDEVANYYTLMQSELFMQYTTTTNTILYINPFNTPILSLLTSHLSLSTNFTLYPPSTSTMSQTITTKRHREANDVVLQPETPKRLKNTFNNNNNNVINNNNNIINQQQDTPTPTPTQYLLDFFTTIPFEPDPFLNLTHQPEPDPDDDEKEKVIKHLFEASDDELGLPSRVVDDVTTGDDDVTGFGDIGLWELEDEVANYYTLMQSELFMQ
ncbi:uncharacterized protein LOC143619152 [Bidens hawaiensis]|uniref:uncharacterized protein LOC143619152 n=1 Tax=Bidens hawaiensis TaxID=980011 RepID=UPI00404B27E2